jgi:hypothetical protein
MPGAQMAAVDYAPAGWPPETYAIVRRVRVDADQLVRAPGGTATHAYAVSSSPLQLTHDAATR